MTPLSHSPIVYELAAEAWLQELSAAAGHTVSLANVPQDTITELQASGFDAVWLTGVWKHGANPEKFPEASLTASSAGQLLNHHGRQVPSAVAIYEYAVDQRYGGDEALDALRARLKALGISLYLDFTPNHFAADHSWIKEHSDYLVQGGPEDIARRPDRYFRSGETIFARGRGPETAWSGTVQVDYRKAVVRQSMALLLNTLAGMCDGLFCATASLICAGMFRITWGGDFEGEDPEFWPDAIASVKKQYPDFAMIAESNGDGSVSAAGLFQFGFDFAYDKRLYDLIIARNVPGIFVHLRATGENQRRMVRFIEPRGETRIGSGLGNEYRRPAAVLATTLPGMRLLHQGQLQAAGAEQAGASLAFWYRALLHSLRHPVIRMGQWTLLDVREAWPWNWSFEKILAYCWRLGEHRRLVVINFADHPSQAFVSLRSLNLAEGPWRLQDEIGPDKYIRQGNELTGRGLFLYMLEFGCSIMRIERIE
jgi:hypothetical protein